MLLHLKALERNYSTTKKELLIIIWATKRLRQYLLGCFTIRGDYQALKWLQNVKDAPSRFMRWRLKLEEHEYDIKYTRRKDNTAADALS